MKIVIANDRETLLCLNFELATAISVNSLAIKIKKITSQHKLPRVTPTALDIFRKTRH